MRIKRSILINVIIATELFVKKSIQMLAIPLNKQLKSVPYHIITESDDCVANAMPLDETAKDHDNRKEKFFKTCFFLCRYRIIHKFGMKFIILVIELNITNASFVS